MRAKIGLVLACGLGLAMGVGLAWAKEAPKAKAGKEKAAPPGMVAVPAGEFIMGMSAEEGFQERKKFYGDQSGIIQFMDGEPVHRVYLDAYYIDKYEVTQAEYDQCVAAGPCRANKKEDGFSGPRQPVVGVSWDDAQSYCAWSGKGLPTEAQWEKAARGTDGRRKYPWGHEFDGKKANFCDRHCEVDWTLKDYDDGYAKTAPVGSYAQGASPYGALDMAGNVREWVADWYQADYYRQSPESNPRGPETGLARVLRGGAWRDPPQNLLVSARLFDLPSVQGNDTGFRCAKD